MKRISFLILFALLCAGGFAQQLTLSFVAQDARNHNYLQLSRVVITNVTQGWTETLTYPDTIAAMTVTTVGVEENVKNSFGISPNHPNPFCGTTYANVNLVEPSPVTMDIMDMNGRRIGTRHFTLLRDGMHRFRVDVADAGVYFLTLHQNGKTTSVKMVNNGNASTTTIEYVGEIADATAELSKNCVKGTIRHPFVPGDIMNYTGYVIIDGEEIASETVEQIQRISETIILPVATTGRPCRETPTVTDYDDNIYNTVQIGSQCWMKENLKTLHYANGDEIPHLDNPSMLAPSYAYPDNIPGNMDAYGLLYNWPAVMNGAVSSDGNPSGVQGICPTGWHVPSDAEWMEMELAIGVSSEEVEGMNTYRGNVAVTLAGGMQGSWSSSTETGAPGNFAEPDRNLTGFSVLPAGTAEGMSAGFREMAVFWSSTLFSEYNGILRTLYYTQAGVRRNNLEKALCASVRCVKD